MPQPGKYRFLTPSLRCHRSLGVPIADVIILLRPGSDNQYNNMSAIDMLIPGLV